VGSRVAKAMLRLRAEPVSALRSVDLPAFGVATGSPPSPARPAGGRPLLVALRTHLLDLTLESRMRLRMRPALRLDLLLAETTRAPTPPRRRLPGGRRRTRRSAAAEDGAGAPPHLKPALVRARVLAKISRITRSGRAPRLQLELQVSLLRGLRSSLQMTRSKRTFELQGREAPRLAHADEVSGIDCGAALDVSADDLGPRWREVGQLRIGRRPALGSIQAAAARPGTPSLGAGFVVIKSLRLPPAEPSLRPDEHPAL